MTTIDLSFLVRSPRLLPVDNHYALIGAVSRKIRNAHDAHDFAIAPLTGRQVGNRQMKLTDASRFVIRTHVDHIQRFFPLAGKSIDIHGRTLVLGVPSVHPLTPHSSIRSRLVTIKGYFDSALFQEAVRRQLDALGVGECEIEIGRQRTLRIKRCEIVGFETKLHRLNDHDSINVATKGIGGRRHMGCGFFVPAKSGALLTTSS